MPADNPSTISRDAIFDILSSRRRRFVLDYLRENDGAEDLTELATALAASEANVPPEQLESHERKRAYVSLYQTHIPRLVDEGVIAYDADAGRVSLSSSIDEVLPYLDVPDRIATDETPIDVRVYPLLAGVGLCVYLFVVFGGPPTSVAGVGVAVLGSLFLVSSAHWLYSERPFADT